MYSHGSGSNLYDVDGNRYVDLTAGFGALLLGYPPNAPETAARAALDTLPLALGDVYASETKVRACEAIAALFPEPGARVMLGLSGADAVTCALKTAALATKRPRVLAFEGSYHGLSHGPLAATGFSSSFREPFAAQLGDFVTFVPYPNSDAELETCLAAVRVEVATGAFGAVLVEPILGRGGCVVPPSGFLAGLRAICDETGTLLVADEIWSGVGRTGKMLASAYESVVPDVVCLGKGLGGGLPISACLGRASVMDAWGAHGGSTIHTGTHFGSPPACAAALATLEGVRGLVDRAAHVGDAFRAELEAACGAKAKVRGRGLMIGIELADAKQALAIARALLVRGYVVLTGGIRGDALTLSPPLTIEPELLSAFATALGEALAKA
ncbi:Acetylornithine aminotransferase [Labilithrix luteola]|uniref:Acetylornithine aminotransferase n=1 Tax=Labilithrix luteola TaxID=1391654 RepID=A0A0K1PYH1_9BACT|nr:Acetylornithine aminotransferase [Labilithrix luteola]